MRFAVIAGVVILVAVIAMVAPRRRVTDRDVAWLAGGTRPSDPEIAEVYRRYLERHRSHRRVGGLLGVAFAMVYGIAAQSGVTVGVGNGSPFGDLLFCGLAGVLLGALSAESYRLTEPRDGRRIASLAQRRPLPLGGLVTMARVLAVLALVAGGWSLLVRGEVASLVAAGAGVVAVILGELARAAIANRRRPLLSRAAAEVDARIRAYAGRATAHLELSAAALALGWAISALPESVLAPLALLSVPMLVSLLVIALLQLHHARPRPPRGFEAFPLVTVGAT